VPPAAAGLSTAAISGLVSRRPLSSGSITDRSMPPDLDESPGVRCRHGLQIAMRRDLRRYGNLTSARKIANWILDVTIRYGYQTRRALAGIAALYLIAFAAFLIAQHQGNLIVATNIYNPAQHPTALRCVTGYPCFYPAGYAFDLVVPLINIHQAEYWQPNGNHWFGWIWILGGWITTASGWFLATLLVVGYSGLARQQ
jgi:hypothetical protein